MKRLFNTRILTLTIFLLLGALPAAAVERPFALRGNGASTFITDEAGNLIGANVTGSGTATHLGLWTTSGRVNFTLVDGVIRSSGVATIIASDGDKLQAELEGQLDPATNTDQGVFRFIGGTGRFEGASGSANFVVTINPLTGAFELTMVGSINY